MGTLFKVLLNALDVAKGVGGWFKARKVKEEKEQEFDAKHKTVNYFDKYGDDTT